MTEQWKDIPGYRGLYQVSDQGRVKSFHGKGKILKQSKRPGGYRGVTLSKNAQPKSLLVHRLVALAFHGPAKNRQVNHKNGKPNDNRSKNLEWLTAKEHLRHTREILPESRQPSQKRKKAKIAYFLEMDPGSFLKTPPDWD